MKSFPLLLALFAGILCCPGARAGEIQFRASPQFGVMTRMEQNMFNRAFKKMILVLPEGNLSYQISRKWFVSGSFTYARLRDKLNTGLRQSGHINVFGGSMGVKIFSSVEEPTGGGDFFDVARWWFGLEFGPYVTAVRSPMIGTNTDVDLAFNFGGGFDYYFHKHFAAGIQTKFHYVNYSPDDYILFSFGPGLVARF